jgi:hypothetical protein
MTMSEIVGFANSPTPSPTTIGQYCHFAIFGLTNESSLCAQCVSKGCVFAWTVDPQYWNLTGCYSSVDYSWQVTWQVSVDQCPYYQYDDDYYVVFSGWSWGDFIGLVVGVLVGIIFFVIIGYMYFCGRGCWAKKTPDALPSFELQKNPMASEA